MITPALSNANLHPTVKFTTQDDPLVIEKKFKSIISHAMGLLTQLNDLLKESDPDVTFIASQLAQDRVDLMFLMDLADQMVKSAAKVHCCCFWLSMRDACLWALVVITPLSTLTTAGLATLNLIKGDAEQINKVTVAISVTSIAQGVFDKLQAYLRSIEENEANKIAASEKIQSRGAQQVRKIETLEIHLHKIMQLSHARNQHRESIQSSANLAHSSSGLNITIPNEVPNSKNIAEILITKMLHQEVRTRVKVPTDLSRPYVRTFCGSITFHMDKIRDLLEEASDILEELDRTMEQISNFMIHHDTPPDLRGFFASLKKDSDRLTEILHIVQEIEDLNTRDLQSSWKIKVRAIIQAVPEVLIFISSRLQSAFTDPNNPTVSADALRIVTFILAASTLVQATVNSVLNKIKVRSAERSNELGFALSQIRSTVEEAKTTGEVVAKVDQLQGSEPTEQDQVSLVASCANTRIGDQPPEVLASLRTSWTPLGHVSGGNVRVSSNLIAAIGNMQKSANPIVLTPHVEEPNRRKKTPEEIKRVFQSLLRKVLTRRNSVVAVTSSTKEDGVNAHAVGVGFDEEMGVHPVDGRQNL